MDESSGFKEDTMNLNQRALQALTESIEEISSESREFSRQAGWLKRLDSLFNVAIVILGVAAPAIVTYLTQQNRLDPVLTMRTILLVAVTGAVAMLRGVMRFGEKYGYTVMTAMKLRELESNARLEMEEIIHTSQGGSVHVQGKLTALNREVQKEWTEIIRRHLASGGRGGEGS